MAGVEVAGTNWLVTLVAAALGAGALDMVRQGIRWVLTRRRQSTPEAKEARRIHEAVAQADESIVVVARTRDALVADNQRLREEIMEINARRIAERAEWAAERAELRAELEAMERRREAALAEVQALKAKHGFNDRTRKGD